jgi:hypothetical protein
VEVIAHVLSSPGCALGTITDYPRVATGDVVLRSGVTGSGKLKFRDGRHGLS